MEQISVFPANREIDGLHSAVASAAGDALYREPHWFAAYTRAQHEKIVAQQLHANEVEHYLPLCESVRKWKDRRKLLQMPLFPGYVFVRLSLFDRLRVLQIPGIVNLVGFSGHPEPLPEIEINVVRELLRNKSGVQSHPFLKAGCRVRVTHGSLAGTEGILVREKKNFRLVVSIELIMRSIAVEINGEDVELVS